MPVQKILVCGATGFIGRNLVTHLAGRADVEVHAVRFHRPAFDVPNVIWHQADLRVPADVDRVLAGMDVVVQAAATTSGAKDIVSRPYIHVTDNAVMNSLILRACHDLSIGHLVFFSCTVMYPSSTTLLTEEDFNASDDISPRYFGVGWTKVYIEKMCDFFSRLGRTRHTVLRHSNIYGPHDKFDLDRSHVFGATVTKVLTASDGRLVVWGAGEEARDLLHIDDLCDAVSRSIDKQAVPYALYNVGCGKAISVKDLVATIIRLSGRDLKIEFDLSKPSIPTRLALDCTKIAQDLGWYPRVELEDGIVSTLAWWRQNIGPTL